MNGMRWLGVAMATLTTLAAPAPEGLAAPVPEGDPVLAARASRAAAQGVSVDDLPAVPRGILEPPPLPPPEIHPKDLRPRRGVKRTKGAPPAKTGQGKGAAARKGTAAPRKAARKRPAKAR